MRVNKNDGLYTYEDDVSKEMWKRFKIVKHMSPYHSIGRISPAVTGMIQYTHREDCNFIEINYRPASIIRHVGVQIFAYSSCEPETAASPGFRLVSSHNAKSNTLRQVKVIILKYGTHPYL